MLQVQAIPAFDDNYIWLLQQDGSPACAVVDPGDEVPVLQALQQQGLQLTAILITHKHYDHVGGIAGLKQQFPDATVFGPAHENISGIDVKLAEGDVVEIAGTGLSFQVLDVPGHTEGHIAYYGYDSLFCGDTLFAAGCGRVFSGSFQQLSAALQKIKQLPTQTRVYCAHEYTLDNLGFAAWVEPDSQQIKARQQADQQLREQGQATVPSLLGDELQTNPFLRTGQPAVIAAAQRWVGHELDNDEQVFTALRQWKDRDYD
ncbi:MAG: hydroxyacylglutathione hydrolase [Chromatiales bacterium]|jgi:hydroxyacylglutathione hydrolase